MVFDGPRGKLPLRGYLKVGKAGLKEDQCLLEGVGQADVAASCGQLTQCVVERVGNDVAASADFVDCVCERGGCVVLAHVASSASRHTARDRFRPLVRGEDQDALARQIGKLPDRTHALKHCVIT